MHARLACVLVAAALTLAGGTGAALAADGSGGGDLALGSSMDLSQSTDDVIGTGGVAPASGGDSIVPGEAAPIVGDAGATTDPAAAATPTGTTDELELRRARLVAERNELQRLLLRHESDRRAAELRHDDAVAAIAERMVTHFDRGRDDLVQALMQARDAADPDTRTQLVAALEPADRALFTELDAATALVAQRAQVAEATRTRVLSIGTSITAIDGVLEERTAPTKRERDRAAGKRYAVDADYVFATGPIPAIGYWGEVSGGGLLSGWMGYAGAAVGGVGCTPPDPSMRPTGSIESGEASWYGPGFQGNSTANGEVFDTGQLTAAHKTLPFGSIVRVYSSATARCVFVRINDRGPYVDGRVIDLSRAAADAIGMESVAPVQLEVYAPG
jgi:rare lipoprotein A